jgi:hypothetical protein
MRYMVMHYSDEATEAGQPPSPELMAEMGAFMEESAKAGVLLAAEGVAPSSLGARLTVEDGTVRVVDGPFAEAKEIIAGFAILEVGSKEEAIQHAKRFARISGSSRVDIRAVADF